MLVNSSEVVFANCRISKRKARSMSPDQSATTIAPAFFMVAAAGVSNASIPESQLPNSSASAFMNNITDNRPGERSDTVHSVGLYLSLYIYMCYLCYYEYVLFSTRFSTGQRFEQSLLHSVLTCMLY